MATREQIEKLKEDWTSDPSWDIERTQGFEEHREELEAFAREVEREGAAQHRARLLRKAKEIGAPGNVALASYVIGLEARIGHLEQELPR